MQPGAVMPGNWKPGRVLPTSSSCTPRIVPAGTLTAFHLTVCPAYRRPPYCTPPAFGVATASWPMLPSEPSGLVANGTSSDRSRFCGSTALTPVAPPMRPGEKPTIVELQPAVTVEAVAYWGTLP